PSRNWVPTRWTSSCHPSASWPSRPWPWWTRSSMPRAPAAWPRPTWNTCIPKPARKSPRRTTTAPPCRRWPSGTRSSSRSCRCSRSRTWRRAGPKRRRRISGMAVCSTRSTSRAGNKAMATTLTSRAPGARRILPGRNLTLGLTLTYLCLVVLLSLSAAFLTASSLSWNAFWQAVTAPRVLASYRLSFGAALLAAAVNAVFGGIVAWVLARYEFPGKRLIDALVDLPFALPTAVAGIALTALYAPNGWLGGLLAPLGIQVAFKPLGVVVALIFIGLPFVV